MGIKKGKTKMASNQGKKRCDCTVVLPAPPTSSHCEKNLEQMLRGFIGERLSEVISPVEAQYINELTLHQDQWWSSQGLEKLHLMKRDYSLKIKVFHFPAFLLLFCILMCFCSSLHQPFWRRHTPIHTFKFYPQSDKASLVSCWKCVIYCTIIGWKKPM